MKKIILKIGGMSCNGCRKHVENYLNQQEGVNASVDLEKSQALIEYDESKLTIQDLENFIEESGYKSLGLKEN